jgi:hypothetical protein
MSWNQLTKSAAALLLLTVLAACTESQPITAPGAASFSAGGAGGTTVPTPLVTVTHGLHSVELWPFTGTDLHGAESDPINLLFPAADARSIRAALLALPGDRSAFGFPNVAPFNCTWADAVGANQSGYTSASGWTGSGIQLECGDYGPMRFHVRLFPAGEWTLANAHFEVLIPGTQAHEVLSWELAETLLMVDFIRSGKLLGMPTQTQQINPAPYRGINPLVYNGLPLELRAAIGGPLSNQSTPVPILSDGRATILPIAATAGEAMQMQRDWVLEFDQVIPKPFCASGPFDYLYVKGPIQFRQRVVVSGSGNYISQFHGYGMLELTPVNPLTSPPTPIGETFHALVNEHYRNIVTDRTTNVSNVQMQVMLPPNSPFRGRLHAQLTVGPGGATISSLRIDCN